MGLCMFLGRLLSDYLLYDCALSFFSLASSQQALRLVCLGPVS